MACKTKIPALDSNRKELSDMCKFLRVKQKEGTIFNVSFTSHVLHKRIQVLKINSIKVKKFYHVIRNLQKLTNVNNNI